MKAFDSTTRALFAAGMIIAVVGPCLGMVQKMGFDEIVDASALAFLGSVVSLDAYESENGQMIFTRVTFAVEEILHGRSDSESIETLELSFAGGEVNGRRIKVSDVPVLILGEAYVVLAREDGRPNASPVVGVYQGLFRVIEDPVSGERYPTDPAGRAMSRINDGKIVKTPLVLAISNGALQLNLQESMDHEVQVEVPVLASPAADPHALATRSKETPTTEDLMKLDDLLEAIRSRKPR